MRMSKSFLHALWASLVFCSSAQAQAWPDYTTASSSRPPSFNTALTIYTLNYLPPMEGYSGSITPRVTLQRDGYAVAGSSSYGNGRCGNGVPNRSQITGYWNSDEVNLSLGSDSPTLTLSGKEDTNTGIVSGHASNGRLFALVPGEVHLKLSTGRTPYSKRNAVPNKEADELEQWARRQMIINPPKAKALWLEALNLRDKQTCSALDRIEARIRLAHFYCDVNRPTEDPASGLGGDASSAKAVFHEVENMVASNSASKEANADPNRWAGILESTLYFYDCMHDSIKSESTFWEMISWLERSPENAEVVANQLENHARNYYKDFRKAEKIRLQALEIWKRIPDKNIQARAFNSIIYWYRSKREYPAAEEKTRELAKLLGLNPAELQFPESFRQFTF